MAVDVSTIALAIDSTSVVQAKSDLDNFAPSAAAVEKATDRVTTSNQGMSASFGAAANSATRARGEMSDAAAKYIAALEKEIATFGATRAEIERLETASLGFSKAERDKAAALGATIDAMHREEEAAKMLAAQQDRNAASAAAFIARLQEQTAVQGLSKTELLAYQAAQLGITKEAAPLIAGLGEAGKEMEHLGFRTARSKTELLVLAHELSQGNFKRFGGSLMVLGEQTGIMGLAFSAAGIAILGSVGAMAAFAFAAIKGASEQETLRKSLILTGDAAGITQDRFQEMARTIAASTDTGVRSAQASLQALVSSGRFGSAALTATATAAQLFEHATGEAGDKVIAKFEKMADGVARWAQSSNEQYHYLTAAQLEQIKTLEDQGRTQEAMVMTMDALADHVRGTTHDLGYMASAWNKVTTSISDATAKMLAWGKAQTIGDAIKTAQNDLDRLKAAQNGTGYAGLRETINAGLTGDFGPQIAAQQALLDRLKESAATQTFVAGVAERSAQTEQAKSEFIKLQNENLSKQEKLKKEIEKIDAIGAASGASPESIKALEDAARAKSAGNHKARVPTYHAGNPEDLDLQAAQKAIAEEAALYATRDKMLTTYHSARIIDDTTYYAGRQTAQDLYLEKTKEGYAKEFALLQSRVDGAKDGAERIKYQKQLVDAQAQYNKLLEGIASTGAIDAITRIGNAQKEAAKQADAAAKELQKKIDAQQKAVDADQKAIDQQGMTKHQIEALKISRLEDAAATDAQTLATAVKNGASDKEIEQLTKLLALDQKDIDLKKQNLDASTKFATGAQAALSKYQDSAASTAAYTEKAISGSFSRLEDAIVNFTKTGKLNLGSLFQFMADEFIRQQARILIAQAAGGGSGGSGGGGIFGAVLGAVGKYFGGGSTGLTTSQYSTSGFATGTNPNYGNEGINFGGPRAGGGSVSAGTAYLVGEKGPEILRMGSQGGHITPNDKISGGGSSSVTLNVINNGPPVKATQSQRETSQGSVIDLVIEAVAHDMASGGKIHDATQRRFQLNPGGSTPRY